MSMAEVERFLADVKTDPKLQEAVRGKAADAAGLVAIVSANGYDVTVDDVQAHIRAQRRELSDEEIDAVVGAQGWFL